MESNGRMNGTKETGGKWCTRPSPALNDIYIYPVSGLKFDRGNLPPCLADWPQCFVNETVVFGQIGRALFHL